MRLTSSLALSGLLAASLVPAMAQTVAPAQSNSAPIVTTSPGASNGTSTTGVNTNGTGTAAGTAATGTAATPAQGPATTSATMGGGAGNGPGTSTGTSPGTGTAATGTVITPSMSGAALSNAGNPANPANGNPAVDTTGAKPMAQPAKGANSFTEGQAKSRLASNGFTDISTLTKDADGVWRGRATKAARPATSGSTTGATTASPDFPTRPSFPKFRIGA